MRAKVTGLSDIGLITDKEDFDLPPNAWTSLNNIRLQDGKVENFPGHSEYSTPTVTPYYLLPVTSGANYFWMYPGLDKVYVFDGTTHTNITRQTAAVDVDYTGAATDRWNGGVLNGLPVINNSVDHPQMWSPATAATKLQILTAWDTNWTCKVIRPFKYFLIALNMTESASSYPHKLRWSNSADPGAVPSAWTPASSNDAGSNVLGETDGHIVDGLPMGDIFVIYKEDSVYGMQYIGGNDVFRFYRMGSMPGALAQECMKSFPGGHFVVTKRDVYIHDGQTWRSVIDEVNRALLFDAIDPDNYASTYVAHDPANGEMWVCYPDTGQTLPNKALIYNYEHGTWYQRDLPTNTAFITKGVVTTAAYTWNTLPYTTWEDWTGSWASRGFSPVAESMVGASDTLYKFGDGNQHNSVNVTVYAERTGLKVGNAEERNTVTAIYPMACDGTIDIYVGKQEVPGGSVTWNGPFAFDPSTDYKINCRVTGLYHCVKFQTTGDVAWCISGYEAEFVPHSAR